MPAKASPFEPPTRNAALPMKDALRSIRYGLRRGRRLLDPVVSTLPRPLGAFASRTLSNVDTVGSEVDRVLSNAAHRLLDRRAAHTAMPLVLVPDREIEGADVIFAQTVYAALQRAFRRFGRTDMLISERLAAQAFRTATRTFDSSNDQPQLAAGLLLAMIDADVIGTAFSRRFGPNIVEDDHEAQDMAIIGLFAVMLWLLVKHSSEGEAEDDLIGLCCDVALALRAPLLAARNDRAGIARLLRRYADAI